MFSSSNNINPFPNLPSSSSSSFQVPFVDGEAAGYFSFHHHHHHDPLLAGYLVPVGPNYNPGAAIPHHGLINNMGELTENRRDQDHGGDGKRPARKDRHSKISTSQGLRDRRVRLSIGISREFFDLQDMLGFDTASKTLEWLLGKSRKDIEELEEQVKNNRTNHKNSSSSSFELDPETNEEDEANPSEKKVKKSPKDVFAKESRAKARERARVRTREKLCTSSTTTTTTSSPTKSCPPDHCHHHHHHHNHQSNPYGFTQLPSHNVNNMASFLALHEKPSSSNNRPFTLHHHQHQHNINEEAILIQRKLMSPATPENSKGFVEWDISNAIRRSTISGATNLSTELQMYGNP